MINRQNILQLIGENRAKYHSCIITCYSLDFSFFEEIVLRTFRVANIRNVNVFADGYFLEKAQEETTGKEFKYNKTYNFQPVYEKGVFHPKIMLLSGVRHGLLIIGSGNITSSGLSTNDEIWGAFHLDSIGNENAPLFGAIWKYLQPYLDKTLGFVRQKIEWMRQQSPWLEELPVTNDWISLDSLSAQLKFIGNSAQKSTLAKLVENIRSSEVEELTVISPYYDKSGQLLRQLKEQFNPQQIRCLVDPTSGSIPSELDRSIATQFSFYNWSDCVGDYQEPYNRLHAKLFHFKLRNEEYLFLGSANATIGAMGSVDSLAQNGEAGILLKRTRKEETWIQNLNIKIPETTIELGHFKNQGIGEGSVTRVNYKYRILYAEMRVNVIEIYLNKDCQDQITVSVLDRSDLPVECVLMETNGDSLIAQITDPEVVFKISIIENNVRISNYCIVHRLEALLRCNPDPNQAKLDAMFDQDFVNGEGITDLLQFVDYKWADDESSFDKKVTSSGSSSIRRESGQDQVKQFEELNTVDFNRVSAESLLKQSGELSNPNVKIAEFLSLYTSGVIGKEDDFSESEEQKLLEDEVQQGDGEEAKNKGRKSNQGSKEKKAIIKYFKKLDAIYNRRLSNLFKTQALTQVPTSPITLRSLSSILIAVYIVQLKYGKKFTVQTNDLDEAGEAMTMEVTYISSGRIIDTVESLKGFLVNVLGKFLLLAGAGYKNYEFDLLNQKLLANQVQLLVKSTCLILNTTWLPSERVNKNVLILNCLYFSLGNQMFDDRIVYDIDSKLNAFKNKAGYIIPEFHEQLEDFKNQLLPEYLDWFMKFSDTESGRNSLIFLISDLKSGNIIFSSKIGFNVVKKVTPEDQGYRLTLSRAGYPFRNGEYELNQVQFGEKCILYRK